MVSRTFGVLAAAMFCAVGLPRAHAQSSDAIAPPPSPSGSAEQARKSTEPPRFDADSPTARAERAKPARVRPPTTAAPATPPPRGDAAPPKAAATTSSSTTRAPWVDPWAEPEAAPAPPAQPRPRRRQEPPKVIGIDSLGRSSEDLPRADTADEPQPRSPSPRPTE